MSADFLLKASCSLYLVMVLNDCSSSFSYFYIFSLVFMEMALISLLICWRVWLSFGMVLGWGCWCELFEFVFFCS